MRQLQRFGLAAVMGGALLALTLATPASARKFQMSGNWIIRNGQVFIPLQFATAIMDTTGNVVHQSMGNLSGAFFFPNGPMPVLGGVEALGSNPASIMVPKHVAVGDVMAAIPLAGVTLVQITTNFGVDAPYLSETLAGGGGPGSFTWCPNDELCTAQPVPASRGTDPPNQGDRNGRIIYVAGANQFGGTLQIGLLRGGYTTALFAPVPFRVGYNKFGGSGTSVRNLAPGKGTPLVPATEKVYLERAFVTQPTMPPAPFNLILYPGPKLTTGMGLTNTGTGAVFYLPTVAVGPNGTLAGQKTSNYGFSHTTGTVVGQQSIGTGGQDFFTFMGSDARTPLGAGNITTVAGGVSFRNTLAGQTPYVSMHRFKVTLGAPIPSMSPAGFAAAGALMLLAVGYALRRRLS